MARLAESPPPFLNREFGLQQKDTLNEDIVFTPHQVFVLMPFLGQEMDDVYRAIKDGCSTVDLNATRADEAVGSGIVMREFVRMMSEAEFLIFDLTHERPNVYYELGYAHGMGNGPYNMLLLAKCATPIHFDVAHFRVQFYSTLNDLSSMVATNLTRMARIYFHCPQCSRRVNAPKDRVGQEGKCPGCGKNVVIPACSSHNA